MTKQAKHSHMERDALVRVDILSDHIRPRERLLEQRDYRRLCAELGELIARERLVITPAAFDSASDATRSVMAAHSQSVADSLVALASAPAWELDRKHFDALVTAARAAVPRTALMLSGGGVLGNFHFGVLRRLLNQGLLPDVISGASAGAFAAAMAATHGSDSLRALISSDRLAAPPRNGPTGRGLFGMERTLDSERLSRKIADVIPDLTFAEALVESGRAINISVTSTRDATGRILNPLTTPDVLLRGAVLASCAVPGHFEPVTLQERRKRGGVRPFLNGETWVDGSLSADMPAEHLESLYGVRLTIASIANPMVLPWMRDPHSEMGLIDGAVRLSAHATKTYLKVAANLALMASPSSNLNFLLRCCAGVASQTYTGHINILPRKRWHDPFSLMEEADSEALRAFVVEGERSTESRLTMLRACTAVDRALDRVLRNPELGVAAA